MHCFLSLPEKRRVDPGLLGKPAHLFLGVHDRPGVLVLQMVTAKRTAQQDLPGAGGDRRMAEQRIDVQGVEGKLGVASQLQPAIARAQCEVATGVAVDR